MSGNGKGWGWGLGCKGMKMITIINIGKIKEE